METCDRQIAIAIGLLYKICAHSCNIRYKATIGRTERTGWEHEDSTDLTLVVCFPFGKEATIRVGESNDSVEDVVDALMRELSGDIQQVAQGKGGEEKAPLEEVLAACS